MRSLVVPALCAAMLAPGGAALASHQADAEPEPTAAPLLLDPDLGLEPRARYEDVPRSHFASRAVKLAAQEQDWIRFDGERFHPDRGATRRIVVRALYRAFARTELPDLSIRIRDVSRDLGFWRAANVAVKLGWIRLDDGRLEPDTRVTKAEMAKTFARALGMRDVMRGIREMTAGAKGFDMPARVPAQVVAAQLMLHYNYPNGGRELMPSTVVSRADVAYALAQAANASWRLWHLQRFGSIELPQMTPLRRKVVAYAMRYNGHPYVWAGHSHSGFDCSGFVWWVMRSGLGNAGARGYEGWSIPERSSYDMAAGTRNRLRYGELKPLDLVFWDVEGEFRRAARAVGHAGIYLGNGWFVHSSGSRAGSSIDWMGDGYWRDRLVWGRRVVPRDR